MTKLGCCVALAMLAGCPNGPLTTLTTKTGGPTETGTTLTNPTTSNTGTTPTGAADWCQVQGIFNANCVVCHNTTLTQGGLDLATDPYGATVGVTSPVFGVELVTPGDPQGSLLFRKMAGTQSASQGTEMPPGATLSSGKLAVVEQWIQDGASSVCDGTIPTTPSGAYHPTGWADPSQHGLTTKLQTGTDTNGTDCRSCHGSDLTGGTSGVSCDTCHQAEWRTTCTYCHGGVDDSTGAPPTDINGDTTGISFPEHTVHGSGPDHPAYDCTECHAKPVDVLTPGHIWDDTTMARAEMNFSGGISDRGTVSGTTCSNLWCHGDGAGDNGSVSIGSGPFTCTGCHSTGNGLNGSHGDHLGGEVNADCATCHGDVNTSMQITDDNSHVDGTVQVNLPSGMTWDGSSCDGSCHGENHNNRRW